MEIDDVVDIDALSAIDGWGEFLATHRHHRELFAHLLETAPEPVTAQEAADQFGYSRRTALNRLHDLVDEGVPVSTKEVGAHSRVFWYHGDGAWDTTTSGGAETGAESD